IGADDVELSVWCQRILPPERAPVTGLDVDVPADDRAYPTSSEFQVVFWISGARSGSTGNPDLTIEYSFYQRRPAGDAFFNRARTEHLNSKPSTPQSLGRRELTAGVAVPLTSFSPGDYRLEITVTDNVSGQTVA